MSAALRLRATNNRLFVYQLNKNQRRHDMNGSSQIQGGKNWILPKEIIANRVFWDSNWLEIWNNHFCPSMVLNGRSVTMDSGVARTQFCALSADLNPASGSDGQWCVKVLNKITWWTREKSEKRCGNALVSRCARLPPLPSTGRRFQAVLQRSTSGISQLSQ